MFNIGNKVSKKGGDYRFDGTIVAKFQKLSGVERFVVEDDRGVLHIYKAENLEHTQLYFDFYLNNAEGVKKI